MEAEGGRTAFSGLPRSRPKKHRQGEDKKGKGNRRPEDKVHGIPRSRLKKQKRRREKTIRREEEKKGERTGFRGTTVKVEKTIKGNDRKGGQRGRGKGRGRGEMENESEVKARPLPRRKEKHRRLADQQIYLFLNRLRHPCPIRRQAAACGHDLRQCAQ